MLKQGCHTIFFILGNTSILLLGGKKGHIIVSDQHSPNVSVFWLSHNIIFLPFLLVSSWIQLLVDFNSDIPCLWSFQESVVCNNHFAHNYAKGYAQDFLQSNILSSLLQKSNTILHIFTQPIYSMGTVTVLGNSKCVFCQIHNANKIPLYLHDVNFKLI